MMDLSSPPIVFLSGAGGGTPKLDLFLEGPQDATRFAAIPYPGWQRYISNSYSAECLIADLVGEITARVPHGPIRIIGLSIGGHFGYAAALRLESIGRKIVGFCAIDTFMISSSGPSVGWKGRALAVSLELLRARRFAEFARFLRSRFWRALVRLAGSRLPGLLRSFPLSATFFAVDPVFEEELNMRLLIRTSAPWIASLDRGPMALEAPSILLRTKFTASDDTAWRSRCPHIKIFELPGQHHTLFEVANVAAFREVFFAATPDWR